MIFSFLFVVSVSFPVIVCYCKNREILSILLCVVRVTVSIVHRQDTLQEKFVRLPTSDYPKEGCLRLPMGMTTRRHCRERQDFEILAERSEVTNICIGSCLQVCLFCRFFVFLHGRVCVFFIANEENKIIESRRKKRCPPY